MSFKAVLLLQSRRACQRSAGELLLQEQCFVSDLKAFVGEQFMSINNTSLKTFQKILGVGV